jgi:hypothetical protein
MSNKRKFLIKFIASVVIEKENVIEEVTQQKLLSLVEILYYYRKKTCL